MSKLFAVITTIQAPTPAVHQLSRKLHGITGVLVVAGDRKGPMEYQLPHDEASSLHFLSLQTQLESGFSLSSVLPTGHYCRKNIGYLHAVAQGATCIYETDDDNAPLPSWQPREEFTADAVTVSQDPEHHGRGPAWVNVYRYFSREHIWPRGLPLDAIRDDVPPLAAGKGDPTAPLNRDLSMAPRTSMRSGASRSTGPSNSTTPPVSSCRVATGVLSTPRAPGGGPLPTRFSTFRASARSGCAISGKASSHSAASGKWMPVSRSMPRKLSRTATRTT